MIIYMRSDDGWHTPGPVSQLKPDDKFEGMVDAKVVDFWQFAMSDLKMNNTRGYLAEFIVARALGLNDVVRTEWADSDLLWNEKGIPGQGITIEVKSTAKLQAWDQRVHSRAVFSGLKGRLYTPRGGYAKTASFNSMVYVFCAQIAEEHEDYKPLDIGQWTFYVVSGKSLRDLNQKTVSLLHLTREMKVTPVPFADLPKSIEAEAADCEPSKAPGTGARQ